jgi:hypothetical protein
VAPHTRHNHLVLYVILRGIVAQSRALRKGRLPALARRRVKKTATIQGYCIDDAATLTATQFIGLFERKMAVPCIAWRANASSGEVFGAPRYAGDDVLPLLNRSFVPI